MKTRRLFAPTAALLIALFFGTVMTVQAQSRLLKAAPAQNAVINLPPPEVRLVFDRPLLAQGTSIRVTDSEGEQVDRGSGRIDPADPFALVVELPVLFEGEFTVTYTAATVGSSTILSDSYTFAIDLPSPVLSLNVPANGQSFDPGPVPVRLETRFIDFNVYGSVVRLYVDGHLYREWAGMRAAVDGLQPGVHEVRTVLVQFGQEVPDTSTTVYIAIRRAAPSQPEITAPPPPRSTLADLPLLQMAGLLVLIGAMIGLGMWLGRGT